MDVEDGAVEVKLTKTKTEKPKSGKKNFFAKKMAEREI